MNVRPQPPAGTQRHTPQPDEWPYAGVCYQCGSRLLKLSVGEAGALNAAVLPSGRFQVG